MIRTLIVSLFASLAAGSAYSQVAKPMSLMTEEDTAVSGVLSGTASNGALTYRVVTQPAHGSLIAISAAGTFTYEPALNYHGSDSFTFVANDGTSDSAPATVSVRISPVNDKPVVKGAAYSTDEDVAVNGTLTGTDVDEDTVKFRMLTPPRYGSVIVSPGGGFVYTPDANFSGFDKFGYVATDADEDSDEAPVVITVKPINDVPIAIAVMLSMAPNQTLVGQLHGFDADGDTLVYSKNSGPSHGSLTVEANGRFTYTSPDGKGNDFFTYSVSDGSANSEAARVSIGFDIDTIGFVADTVQPQLKGVSFLAGAAQTSPPVSSIAAARDLAVDHANSRLYVLAEGALKIYDIDPSAPPPGMTYRDTVEVSGKVLALALDGRTAFIGGTGKVTAINLYPEGSFEDGRSVERVAYENVRTFPFSPSRDVAAMAVHPAGDRLMVVIEPLIKKLNINNDLLRSDVGNGIRTENLTAADLPDDFGYITQLPITAGVQADGATRPAPKFTEPVSLKDLIYSTEKQVAIGIKSLAFSPDGNCAFLAAVGAQTARPTAFGVLPTSDEGTGGIVVLDVRPSSTPEGPWVQYLGFIPTTEEGEKTADLRMAIRKEGWRIVHPEVQWARFRYSVAEVVDTLASLTPFTSGYSGFTVAGAVLGEMEDSFKDYGYMQAYSRLYPRDMVGASSVAINHLGDFGVVSLQDTNNLGLLALTPSEQVRGYTPSNRPDFKIKVGTGSSINGHNDEYIYSWAYPQKVAFTSDDSRIYIGMAGGTPKANLTNRFGYSDALLLRTERDRPDSIFKAENPPHGYTLIGNMDMQSPRRAATLQAFDSDRDLLSDRLEAYNRWNVFRSDTIDKKSLISTNDLRITDPGKPLLGLTGIPDYLDYGYLLPPSGIGFRLNSFGMPEGTTNFINRGAVVSIERLGVEWNKRYEQYLRSSGTGSDVSVTRPYFIVGLLSSPAGGVMTDLKGEALTYTPGSGSEACFPYFSLGSDQAHDFVLSNDATEPRNNERETTVGFDQKNTEALIRLLLAHADVRKIELDPYIIELIPGLGGDSRIVPHGSREVKDSRRDLDNHMFVTFAGLSVDLDIDSDNDGVLDQNSTEDLLEDKEEEGGKILWANTGDTDTDGVPDYADGYNQFPGQNVDGASADFAPIMLRFPDEVDLATLKFRLTYSSSDPSAVTRSAAPPYQYLLPPIGAYRIWTKTGAQARTLGEIDSGGDFIASKKYYRVSDLPVDAGRRVTLYIESVGRTPGAAEKKVEVEIISDAAGPISRFHWVDSVQVSSGIALKANTKVLLVNNGDADRDTIPDHSDGLDLYKTEGYHPRPEEVESAPLVPITLHLTTTKLDGANIRVRFSYDGADPAAIVRAEAANGSTYTPPTGSLRLWRRNTDGRQFLNDAIRQPGRKVASIDEGGDYIAFDKDFDPADLGFTDGRNTVTLYVEAVRKSDATNDRKILVEMHGSTPASAHLSATSAIAFTALDLQLVRASESGASGVVTAPELSHSKPKVTLTTMKALNIAPNEGGAHLLGELLIEGSITSAACDQSSDGAINEVKVFINDSEEAFATIPTVVTKTVDANSLLSPFPFSATFSSRLAEARFVPGINVVRVEARNPGQGQAGYQEFVVEVHALSPHVGGDQYAQLTIALDGPCSPAAIDKLIASFKIQDIGESNVELTETEPNSLTFRAADGRISVNLTSGAYEVAADMIDKLSATLTHTAYTAGPVVFGQLEESGSSSLLFKQLTVVRGTGTRSSLSLKFSTKITPGAVDGVVASLMVEGQEASNVVLTETAPDSKIFTDADDTFKVTLVSDTSAHSSEDVDSLAVVASHESIAPEPVFFSRMEETLHDNEFFHEAVVEEKDLSDADVPPDADGYHGYKITNGPAALVDQTNPGSLHSHLIRLDGPADFLESIDTVDMGEGPRKVQRSAGGTEFFIQGLQAANPQLYRYIAAWQAAWSDDSLTDEQKVLKILEAVAAHLDDEIQFKIGFAHGFVMGGVSLVVDAKDLVVFIGKAAVKWSPVAVQIRLLTGDDFTVEREFFVSSAESAGELWRFYWMVRNDQNALFEALLTRDNDTIAQLRGKYAPALALGAEAIEEIAKIVTNLTPREKGYYQGRVAFEVIGLFVAWEGKAAALVAKTVGAGAKLTKVHFLKVLAQSKFFKTSAKGQEAILKLADEGGVLVKLASTSMCFTAGTKVHTSQGLVNIEDVHRGFEVFSRDGASGEQLLKSVVDTFVTNPDRLYYVLIRTVGSGTEDDHSGNDETLACTGEHPFWIQGRGFVPAKELRAGNRLSTIGGEVMEVVEISIETAGGNRCFTTYNFEVEDFHTYFVGQSGVWVHNKGEACERIAAWYYRARKRAPAGETPYQTFVKMKASADKLPLEGKAWRLAAKEVNDEMFKLAAKGEIKLDELATYTKWHDDFKGIYGSKPRTVDDLNVHHIVEKWIQEKYLGMNRDWDDIPGFVLKGPDHTWGYGAPISDTLYGKLAAAIKKPELIGDHLAVTTKIKEVYEAEGLHDLWAVTKMWLDANKIPTPPAKITP
jgi:hypothetical protein